MGFSTDRIRHLYGFESHYADLSGLKMHYLDEGEGEPLVMVHGNPSWSFMFRDLVQELREEYRVIVPDHIGCGLSEKPESGRYPFTLRRRSEDLAGLLERLEVRSGITLVLHDWGGPIGMTYAGMHPDRVARLVILNTAGFPLPEGKRLHWSLRWCRKSRLAAVLVLRLNAFARCVTHLGSGRTPLPREVRRAYTGPHDNPRNRLSTLRFVQDIPLTPSDPSFPVLEETGRRLELFRDRPMLLCWGEQDFVFDLDFLAEWMRRFPEAEVHRFSQAGHCLLEEVSGEVAELMRSFIRRHPPKEPV